MYVNVFPVRMVCIALQGQLYEQVAQKCFGLTFGLSHLRSIMVLMILQYDENYALSFVRTFWQEIIFLYVLPLIGKKVMV